MPQRSTLDNTVGRWALVAVALVCLVVGWFGFYGRATLTLNETEINAKIAAKLPITRHKLTADVTATEVTVDLSRSGNEIAITAKGTVIKFGRTYAYTVSAVGVPEYDPVTAAVYLRPEKDQVKILSLTRVQSAAESSERTGKLVATIKKIAGHVTPELKQWALGEAADIAVYEMQRTPVYHLPDTAKGIVEKAVLDEVHVANHHLILKLSFYRLTLLVIFFGIGALVLIGMAILDYVPPIFF